jgi:hypothetical protein
MITLGFKETLLVKAVNNPNLLNLLRSLMPFKQEKGYPT